MGARSWGTNVRIGMDLSKTGYCAMRLDLLRVNCFSIGTCEDFNLYIHKSESFIILER